MPRKGVPGGRALAKHRLTFVPKRSLLEAEEMCRGGPGKRPQPDGTPGRQAYLDGGGGGGEVEQEAKAEDSGRPTPRAEDSLASSHCLDKERP